MAKHLKGSSIKKTHNAASVGIKVGDRIQNIKKLEYDGCGDVIFPDFNGYYQQTALTV